MLVRLTTVTIIEELPDDYMENNHPDRMSVIRAGQEETDAVMSDITLFIDALDESPFTVAVHFMELGE